MCAMPTLILPELGWHSSRAFGVRNNSFAGNVKPRQPVVSTIEYLNTQLTPDYFSKQERRCIPHLLYLLHPRAKYLPIVRKALDA
jgi:hypothetical protein